MSTTPSASVSLVGAGGAVVTGADLLCVMGPSEQGTFSPRLISRHAAMVAEFGKSPALDFVAHYMELTRKPVLFIRLATATAGACGAVDVTGVTGTSAITFTGTPLDAEEIVVEVVTGGTVGTAGIVIRTSRDRGRTWGGNVRLGTATSYLIPDTGITVAFAAGTLVAGDTAYQYCSAPDYNAAGLSIGFSSLAAYGTQPRAILLVGAGADAADDIQDAIDEAAAYETTNARHGFVLLQLRDQYAPAAMQGDPTDVDFAADDTITRNTGSWVTDGFKVGMTITIDGTASNDGDHVVTVVTALVMTVASSPGLALEANVTGADISITGVEAKATHVAALDLLVNGATPTAAKQIHKVGVRLGYARRKSPLYSHRKRRPMVWAETCRMMAHSPHVSAGKVELGPLEGWDINDENGNLVEFDQRVDGGALEARIGCLMTHDDLAGAYVALPLTLDTDDGALSRVPTVLVGQLGCRVAKREMTLKIGAELSLKSDGTITEASAQRIEEYVKGRLEAALLSAGPEGPLANSVAVAISRDTDMRTPGTQLPYTVTIDGYAYLERTAGTVRMQPGG